MNFVTLHISTFLAQKRRHGGVKRSLQLSELASSENIQSIGVPLSHRDALRCIIGSPISVVSMLPVVITLGWRFLSIKGAAATILYGAWLRTKLKSTRATHVMLEVAPNREVILGNVLASLKVPFTAYPHNIEFMVPGQQQSYFRSHDAAFAAEMRVYRSARAVQTISTLDACVLRSLGIEDVTSMPYTPPATELASLSKIQQRRENSRKNGILLLGSVGNPPTRAGLTHLLDLIREQDRGRRFILVGFGTESLASIAPPNVQVLGSVNFETLFDLMVQAEALLIYQPPTSGMLTRIVEAATADIPTYVLGGYLQAHELSDRRVYAIADLSALPKVKSTIPTA